MRRPKQQWIYDLIRQSGSRGINTNQLREITKTVDVPKIVSILNDKGKNITSRREHDGTATYFLANQPKKPIYAFEGNTYRIIGYQ